MTEFAEGLEDLDQDDDIIEEDEDGYEPEYIDEDSCPTCGEPLDEIGNCTNTGCPEYAGDDA